MPGMLFLRDLCDIERRSVTPQGYGGKPAYAAYLADVACHYETRTQRGFNAITAQWEMQSGHMLIVTASTDIQEGDRVKNVRLNRNDSDLVANAVGDALTFQVDGGAITKRGRLTQTKEVSLRMVQ